MEDKRDLYLEERRQAIANQVSQGGRVSVADLADQFGVSEVTVRADLQALADRNLIVRTHGGAVSISRGIQELSLAYRRQQQVPEKERIGVAGAAMISHGDAIILDSSSTALAIARNLKRHLDLTILTNSLAIAYEMLDAPGTTVVMPGGTLRRDMASLISNDGLGMFRKFNIKSGFFGAHGISVSEGLTDVSVGEAEVKRPLIAMCRQVVAVLDATKWGRAGVASFADLKAIQVIITDAKAPADLVEQVRALGIRAVLV
jgi:DeoR/GlpR family transcriptional regulator of sugar metabolism